LLRGLRHNLRSATLFRCSTRFGLGAGGGVNTPSIRNGASRRNSGFDVGAGTESINMIRAGVNRHFGGYDQALPIL
jgi:hypothetical protein